MSLPPFIYAPWNEMAQIMYSFFVPANSRAFFTANGGFLILFLFSLPSGRRSGGWWQISESPLSGISATTRRRIGRSPEKDQNFLYHLHTLIIYIGHTIRKNGFGLKIKKKSRECDVYQRKCITLRIGIYAISETMSKIIVQNTPITVLSLEEQDYISLTDMATAKEGDNRSADIIKNWLRNRYTIEFLGTWEMIHNPDFKVVEFDHFRMSAGLPSFVLSASEWIERTNAIGIIVKKGRYGGTYAHKDIAFEFGSAISVTFKLYLIEEFQRLKTEEQRLLGWSAKRELSKINYRIHTDAIKQNLIPAEVTPAQASIIYANEGDVLNVAMFGVTAKQWREANPDLKGNIRDYATINELICLSNMENLNAVFIEQGMTQSERLVKLNQIAIHQMSVLESGDNDRKLLK